MNRFIEQKEKELGNEKIELEKQDCVVSLELIKQSNEQIEHKITLKAFENIAKSNNFIWKKLNQLSPGSEALEECNEDVLQRRSYFIIPLKYCDDDEDELEMDYESIKRIVFGAKYKLNGQEWVNKMKPSTLKNELVEYKGLIAKKNRLYISYGIHKDRYKENKQIKREKSNQSLKSDDSKDESIATYNDDDDQSDIMSVKSFCNESVVKRWSAMKAAGKMKLKSDKKSNFDKNVILTMTEDPFIQVK